MREYTVIRDFNLKRRIAAAGGTVTLSPRQARHLVLGGFLKEAAPPPAPPAPPAEEKTARGKKRT